MRFHHLVQVTPACGGGGVGGGGGGGGSGVGGGGCGSGGEQTQMHQIQQVDQFVPNSP